MHPIKQVFFAAAILGSSSAAALDRSHPSPRQIMRAAHTIALSGLPLAPPKGTKELCGEVLAAFRNKVSTAAPVSSKSVVSLWSRKVSACRSVIGMDDRWLMDMEAALNGSNPAPPDAVGLATILADLRLKSMDPHSSYLDPSAKNDFDARLRHASSGFGIVWARQSSGFLVHSVTPDGPAASAGIRPGYLAVQAATSPAEKLQATAAMSNAEWLRLLSGPAGQSARFVFLAEPSSTPISVDIDRKLLSAPNPSAVDVKSLGPKDRPVLVISVPLFYRDQENSDRSGGSATADVKKILLQNPGAAAVVLDLRGNGGGLLQEAVELAGLFVPPETPVAQILASTGRGRVLSTATTKPVFVGPMSVLVDGKSASASEVLAGCFQDTRRAAIVGATTYGKGTAQIIVDLDAVLSKKIRSTGLGQANVTSMMFFRPSGLSAQIVGIRPDFSLEARSPDLLGERSMVNPIRPFVVAAADYPVLRTTEWKTPAGDPTELQADAELDLAIRVALAQGSPNS